MLKSRVEILNEMIDENWDAFWELSKALSPLVSENNLKQVEDLLWQASNLGFSRGMMAEKIYNLEKENA